MEEEEDHLDPSLWRTILHSVQLTFSHLFDKHVVHKDMVMKKTVSFDDLVEAGEVVAAKHPQTVQEVHELRKRVRVTNFKATALHQVEGGQIKYYSVWETTIEDLGRYGVGVQLYFELLKSLGILFCILLAINLPHLIICAMGSMLEKAILAGHANTLSKLSVGNLGYCPNSVCVSVSEAVFRPISMSDGSPGLQSATQAIGYLDALSMLVFMVYMIRFAYVYIPRAVEKQDADNVTAADYAVEVTNLPRKLRTEHESYEQKLRDHFTRLAEKVNQASPSKLRVGEDLVQEVCLVREYDGYIKTFFQMGQKTEQLKNCEVGEAIYRSLRGEHNRKRANKLQMQGRKLTEQLGKMKKSLEAQGDMTDAEREVCSAFVMFNSECTKERILQLFSKSSSWFASGGHRADGKFMGRMLKVRQAREPGDLYWENLDYHWGRRVLRQCAGMLCMVIAIIVSVLLLIFFSSVQIGGDATDIMIGKTWVLRPVSGSMSICNLDLFTDSLCQSEVSVYSRVAFTGDKYAPSPVVLSRVPRPSEEDSLVGCADNATNLSWLGFEFADEVALKCLSLRSVKLDEIEVYSCQVNATRCEQISNSRSWPDDNCCTRMENVFQTHTESDRIRVAESCEGKEISFNEAKISAEVAVVKGQTASNDPKVDCFCKAWLLKNPTALPKDVPDICMGHRDKAFRAVFLSFLGIIVILIINYILEALVSVLATWGRYHMQTELSLSCMERLFIVQFVNTGLLFALVAGDFHGATDSIPVIGEAISNGFFDDFTSGWFGGPGSELWITVASQIASTCLMPCFQSFVVKPFMATIRTRGLYTEEALMSIYKHPQWNIALRLAQTLLMCYVIVMYSGGMPFLYVVGILYCLSSFWFDKFTLLRGSEAPPAYREHLVQRAALWLLGAALLHVLVAAWTFSNQILFPSDWGFLAPISTRLFRKDTIPGGPDGYAVQYKLWFFKDDVLNWSAYLQARFVDLGRRGCEGNMLVLFFILACIPCHFVYSGYKTIYPTDVDETNSISTFERLQQLRTEALTDESVLASYMMKANHFYLAAYEGIQTARTIHELDVDATLIEDKAEGGRLGEGRRGEGR